KVVQNTNKQIVKRNEDIVVNVFDDEDINGNPITPLTTENILLKAKPEVQLSGWNDIQIPRSLHLDINGDDTQTLYTFNFTNATTGIQNIENSLGFIGGFSQIEDFAYIEAISNLTDLVIGFKLDAQLDYFGVVNANTSAYFNVFYEISSTPPSNSYNATSIVQREFTIATSPTINYTINETFTISDLRVPIGHRLYLWYEVEVFNLVGTENGIDLTINENIINFKGTATAIDSVIKGVRYIDLIKKNVESISGLDVYAPKFDYGGKFYDQFAFTGNLIKQRDTSFPIKFKDAISTLWEVNADYQILDDKIFIGQFDDFYPNKEIGVFAINPDESLSKKYNPRFTLNQFEFKYKTYEKDRD
ncbi:MAG: hypothetical protein GY739_21715, partial [Mesoflavibacter sp.]|nr:hypothetical protein [Mesoflavibacter sp.]